MQFVPEKRIDVYFRYNNDQTIRIVVDSNDQAEELKTSRLQKELVTANNFITDEKLSIGN